MPAKLSKPLPSLTGIRGIAAIWVMTYHRADMYWPNVPILRDGYRAVDLFFILSGFIMMHVHQDDFRALKRYEVARFFCLRVIRIYPLNTVVLLLMVPFVLSHPTFVTYYRHLSNEHQVIHAYSLGGFWQTLLLASLVRASDFLLADEDWPIGTDAYSDSDGLCDLCRSGSDSFDSAAYVG